MRRTTSPGNRLLTFALVMALAVAIAACGDSDDDGGGDSPGAPAAASRDSSAPSVTGGDTGKAAGGGSEKQRIAATVRGMYEDFAAGDAKGVCAAMSLDARDSVAQNVIGGSTERREDRTCETSFAKFVDAAAGSGLLDSTRKIEIGDIVIDSDLATVTVSAGDRSGKVQLVKEEGDWRFDAAPGAPGAAPGSG